MDNKKNTYTLKCPLPISDISNIRLAHGGGGKLMHELIEKMFIPSFGSNDENHRHDSSLIDINNTTLAFTTDSYVVNPLFFPGGDIGMLAVNGTVNDLAMSGARPLFLSIGFIIEEGLDTGTLWRITNSISQAAKEANIKIITGDTKVVDKGKGDGLFLNTSGIGILESNLRIMPSKIQEGDSIIINGSIAMHGMAVMAVRENLSFESSIASDCCCLSDVVGALISKDIEIHCLKDLTRGGLGGTLNEISDAANLSIMINEENIPIREDVASACEMLGFDPLYVANEGKFIAIIPKEQERSALEIMKRYPSSQEACVIGKIYNDSQNKVLMKSTIGSTRIIDMLSGEQLPRIC